MIGSSYLMMPVFEVIPSIAVIHMLNQWTGGKFTGTPKHWVKILGDVKLLKPKVYFVLGLFQL